MLTQLGRGPNRAAHSRAKAAVLDLQRPGLCETRTVRWREMDSNSRSPGCGEARRNPFAGRFIEDLRTLFDGRSGCT